MFHSSLSPKKSLWYRVPRLIIDCLGTDCWVAKMLDSTLLISLQTCMTNSVDPKSTAQDEQKQPSDK